MPTMSFLETLSLPHDLKNLEKRDLYRLAGEIRESIIETVSANGGHLASNLGVVELTIALHRVLESPRDIIVWDVGHQCYAHKLLTGRAASFHTIRKKGGLSGFPKRSESEHDSVDSGHATTSISIALGMLTAKRACGDPGRVVAFIGDGSLTGGMAFEALSHAGQMGLPLVVILNDNKLSISPNVGALSRYLSRLTASVAYQNIRRSIDLLISKLPVGSRAVGDFAVRFKKSLKALVFKENLFGDLGFEYVGPIDGHNIPVMIHVLTEALRINRPVVIHMVTQKGRGHDDAEEDPVGFHGVSPRAVTAKTSFTFTDAFSQAMLAQLADKRVVAVTAAMATGTGLSAFQEKAPDRFFDVGIAEPHAVSFAAGLAARGLKPVVAIYSTFMQRAVDQVFHDVALPELPVVFALDRAGAVPDDGETHQGIYDIALFRMMPSLVLLAPSSAVEMERSLEWALKHDGPVMLRYPKASCPLDRPSDMEPFVLGRGVVMDSTGAAVGSGSAVASCLIIAFGGLVAEALGAAAQLAAERIACDVCSLRFLKPVDEAWFLPLVEGRDAVLILEEGVVSGGIGNFLSLKAHEGRTHAIIAVAGFSERPLSHASRAELLDEAGLSSAQVFSTMRALLAKKEKTGFQVDKQH